MFRDIAYMIDQSHNLKPKIEAMIQTAIDRPGTFRQGMSGGSQKACAMRRRGWTSSMRRNACRIAFFTDVRPMLADGGRRKISTRIRCELSDPADTRRRSPASAKRRERRGVKCGGIVRVRPDSQ